MSHLFFDYEWNHQEDVRGDELKATWASLKIMIGEECLSKGYDLSATHLSRDIFKDFYVDICCDNFKPIIPSVW